MSNNQIKGKIHSPQFLRKRKMMLVLPILVLPFITMAFWSLGGGSSPVATQSNVTDGGLNMQLPKAQPKDDRSENKLSFYEEADKDSIKLGLQKNNDPFLQYRANKDSLIFQVRNDSTGSIKSPLMGENYSDPNEEKVYQKLAELKAQLNLTSTQNNSNSIIPPVTNSYEQEQQPHRLPQEINTSIPDADPEMNQLNNMMEKIIDIQHPELVNKKLENDNVNERVQVFPVNKISKISSVSLLDTATDNRADTNRFYGIDEENQNAQNAIEAVIHEDQTLVNGAVIKLRLLNNISINGNIIPKDNFIYGTVSLNGERLQIEISSIRVNYSLYPVKLNVYDMDGLEGIYVPGAITRDVAKESLNNATQMMQLSSLDPSVKAQATTAGIDAVKTLLSKKTKLVRVTVKAGYKILLK